jgi:hypothetical protein
MVDVDVDVQAISENLTTGKVKKLPAEDAFLNKELSVRRLLRALFCHISCFLNV